MISVIQVAPIVTPSRCVITQMSAMQKNRISALYRKTTGEPYKKSHALNVLLIKYLYSKNQVKNNAAKNRPVKDLSTKLP